MSVCPGCGDELVQPRTGRRRKFCSPRCKQRVYRAEREFRNADRRAWGRFWEEFMNSITFSMYRTYGGHLEKDGSSTIDACRHNREIDAKLRMLLGGVPLPRAPRGQIIEFPAAQPEVEGVAA